MSLLKCLATAARVVFVVLPVILFAPASLAAETYTIAVIGTGNMGSALGKQFAKVGHRVVYGSRDPSRDSVRQLVEATGHGASATTQKDAARQGEIVILAVPWTVMEEAVRNVGDLRGKVLVDISTGFRQAADGYLELTTNLSTSELIQQWAPGARVVKTPFSAAQVIAHPLKQDESTVAYIASDDRLAKEIVAGLAIQLKLFPLDAGPLRMAKSIDHASLLYLTPLVQGRALTWIWAPRVAVDLSCIATEGWFQPVKDAGDLARFPNVDDVDHQCPPQ